MTGPRADNARRSGWGTFVVALLVSIVTGAAGGYAMSLFTGAAGGGGASPAETGENDGADEAEVSGDQADDATAGENPFAGFRVGDFSLTNADGDPVDQSLFAGEVTVLTFFFTSCNGPCPAIARVMADVQGRTAVGAATGLRFASISVDGDRDTPEVIGSFAASYGADPDRWVFLTGEPAAVRELVRESIGFELREQEGVLVPGPDGALINNILHPTRLLLVGPDRRLIGVYPFNDPDAVDAMVADAVVALN